MSLRRRSVALGLALTGIGGFALTLGLLRSPALGLLIPGAVGQALAVLVGGILLSIGILVTLLSIRPTPEPVTVVPAHVAFASRAPRVEPMPEKIHIPYRHAASRRRPEEQAAMTRLDEQIRDLTRRINKAGVMLATGQISHHGYASYVDDLKKQKGALEANRVRMELHRVE